MNEQAINVATGISNLGMMAMTSAFFLVLAGVMMVTIFRWFKKIMSDMINANNQTMKELVDVNRNQTITLQEISEGLKPTTLMRMKNTTNAFFELSKYKVLDIIDKVKTENHIIDHEATKMKIRTLLTNLHEDRNEKFSLVIFRSNKLNTYTSKEWIDWVADVVYSEVYAEIDNEDRRRTNVQAIYDQIKLDFNHRILNSED